MAAPPAIPPDPDIDRPKKSTAKGINSPNLLKSVKTGDKSRPKRYRRVLLQQGSAIAAVIGIVLLARYFGFISDSVSLMYVSVLVLVVGGILSRSGKAGAAIGFTVVILLLGAGFGLPFLEIYAVPLEPIDNVLGVTSTAGFALAAVDDFFVRPEIDDEVIPGTAAEHAEPVEVSPSTLERSIAIAGFAIGAAIYGGLGGLIGSLGVRKVQVRGWNPVKKGLWRDRPDGNARDTRAPKIESPEPWSGPDDIEGGPETAGTAGNHDFGKNE